MNLIVLHGDDIEKSYVRLTAFIDSAKKRDWEIVRVDPDAQSLPEVLFSSSLFAKEKLIILNGARNLKKSDLKWIKDKPVNILSTLIVYEEGTISASLLKGIPATKVEEYKLPRLLFKFLDSVYPGNAKVSFELFRQVLKSESVEMVFAMFSRLLRDLYFVSQDASLLNYPGWREQKLKSQVSKFKKEELKTLINSLSDADILAKTSQTNLRDSLDFMLATRLE